MREHKYRAWSVAEKMMCDSLDNINLEMLRKSVISHDGDNFTEAIYMQYTGLKDKNGKEIYEGDICKSGDVVVEILFKSGGFIGRCGPGLEVKLHHYGWGIIGNIHEHPHLLDPSAKIEEER